MGQTLHRHIGPVWTMKFSVDGHFLASAGQDHSVIVWRVVGIGEALNSHLGSSAGEFQLVYPEPYRTYSDHVSDVVDIAWSRTNFLLSASIDKTVRLWHVTREDCLQFFKHPDFVTSVDFHPLQDRYFVSGCFDKKIRVWDILPDGHVKEWAQAPEMVTSACFTPDGSMIVAGLYHGQVFFYTYDGMRYYTQIECRNRHGQHKQGRKVTGLAFAPAAEQGTAGARIRASTRLTNKLLVTTNDSRIRLFQMDDYSMLCKYKGLKNDAMQIRASFSESGNHVICGSENGGVYIWNTVTPQAQSLGSQFAAKRDRNKTFETFEAASGI
jgi:WD40 repeat protein